MGGVSEAAPVRVGVCVKCVWVCVCVCVCDGELMRKLCAVCVMYMHDCSYMCAHMHMRGGGGGGGETLIVNTLCVYLITCEQGINLVM